MNLTEKLLSADANKFRELETDKYKSKRLGKILGVKDATVVLRKIPWRQYQEMANDQFDDSGNPDIQKQIDSALEIAVEGIADPSMKNNELMKHFGVVTPSQLAEVIFDEELDPIIQKIADLSKPKDEQVKN